MANKKKKENAQVFGAGSGTVTATRVVVPMLRGEALALDTVLRLVLNGRRVVLHESDEQQLQWLADRLARLLRGDDVLIVPEAK